MNRIILNQNVCLHNNIFVEPLCQWYAGHAKGVDKLSSMTYKCSWAYLCSRPSLLLTCECYSSMGNALFCMWRSHPRLPLLSWPITIVSWTLCQCTAFTDVYFQRPCNTRMIYCSMCPSHIWVTPFYATRWPFDKWTFGVDMLFVLYKKENNIYKGK